MLAEFLVLKKNPTTCSNPADLLQTTKQSLDLTFALKSAVWKESGCNAAAFPNCSKNSKADCAAAFGGPYLLRCCQGVAVVWNCGQSCFANGAVGLDSSPSPVWRKQQHRSEDRSSMLIV